MKVRAYKTGSHGNAVPGQYLAILLALTSLLPRNLMAEGVAGDFGYSLGSVLASDQIKHQVATENKNTTYEVRHLSGDRYFETINVTVSDDARIIGIVARGPVLPSGVCGRHQQEKIRDLQKKYPGWRYYAASDADLLYTDEYSVLLGCEESGNTTYLKLEYVYDAKIQGSN